jgi:hypothetical protein
MSIPPLRPDLVAGAIVMVPPETREVVPEDIDPMARGGVNTDSGTVGVMSSAWVAELERAFDGDGMPVTDAIDQSLGNSLGGIVRIPKTEVRVAAWCPGFGDGSYTAYWGLDEQDQQVSLVIDFGVVANGLVAPAVPMSEVGDSLDFVPRRAGD